MTHDLQTATMRYYVCFVISQLHQIGHFVSHKQAIRSTRGNTQKASLYEEASCQKSQSKPLDSNLLY